MFLFDPDGRLVLIERSRPGHAPYLVTPGGGIEPGEGSFEAAARECAEEVGAVTAIGPVVVVTEPDPAGTVTFHLGIATQFDEALRTGAELSEPGRGSYRTVRVSLDDTASLAGLRPPMLAPILAEHGRRWAAWASAAFAAGVD